ncbi:hypothetical protein B0H19DRAFT_955848 [Mycena capillaripes]|nr:hypothetical protein B0H19DRAFT_955848 [Mycena capillaripes]
MEEADATIGTPCRCGSTALREVQCRNCIQYEASCKQCFIVAHRNNPFHWAEVWDAEKGFFVRSNLSGLGHHLHLGHNGGECSKAMPDIGFEVMANTGAHSLRLRCCGHFTTNPGEKIGDRVAQLLRAGLFPCSFSEPKSAITFSALRQFEIFSAESKVAAFDYCGALRRLSDNAFTASVPDLYENFMRCSRWWGYLTALKRMGEVYGMGLILTHRPKRNCKLFCPLCPEAGFNMDPRLRNLPPHLRHLNQQRDTLDGNFHCTKSTKNSDPRDVSLYEGSGFFPTNEVLNAHLALAPVTKEVSTCNYLNAVNNQDRKKWKNMEITGLVDVQCSHVFIKASVDLQFGERSGACQRHTPKTRGLLRRRRNFKIEVDSIDYVTSYDAACQYSVNVVERFEKYFSDVAHIVRRMRWAVPLLHIQGHQEACMYEFATSYMEATGHFHGETAEVYWPELNQIGTQVTQQSGGHRQDTIMRHHNDWNHKKMVKTFSLLLEDLRKADITFRKQQSNYLGLCVTYVDRVREWMEAKVLRKVDVYRFKKTKVPTLLAIYERMLADEAAIVPNSGARLSKVAVFINDGIRIQGDQLKVRKLVPRLEAHFTETMKKEIDGLRAKLQTSIAKWQTVQRTLTPAVQDHLEELKACPVEHEMLGLPSEFTEEQRIALNVEPFVRTEADLREGAAFDALASVKIVTKALLTLRDRKKKHDSGVYKNTISQKQINDAERRRDLHIAGYMAARDALIRLNEDPENYPPLEAKDTFMKSRSMRRQLGDSRITEGLAWTQAGISSGLRQLMNPSTSTSSASTSGTVSGGSAASTSGTAMPRRQQRKPRGGTTTHTSKPIQQPKKATRKEGWLWTFKAGKMNEEELREWNDEGTYSTRILSLTDD